jgi:hypothetical protein
MPNDYYIDPESGFFGAPFVPIRSASVLPIVWGDENLELTAVVQLDASEHPEIADLNRVLRLEGSKRGQHPPNHYLATTGQEAMITSWIFNDPVACAFSITLPWRGNEDLFRVMAMYGRFLLTTGEIENAPNEGIFWTVAPGEIQRAITTWEASA